MNSITPAFPGYNSNNPIGYNFQNQYQSNTVDPMFEDQPFSSTVSQWERPTYRKSTMLANPDFGNYHFKKGYTAEIWLQDGETVVLSADAKKKTYRTHYSPEYLKSFFHGWLGRLLRYFYLDRLFGLNVQTKNYIFVSAHVIPF